MGQHALLVIGLIGSCTIPQLNAQLKQYTQLVASLHAENQRLKLQMHRIKRKNIYNKNIYKPTIPSEPQEGK